MPCRISGHTQSGDFGSSEQRFSAAGTVSPRDHLTVSEDILGCASRGMGVVLLASRRWRSGMLLGDPQCTGEPPAQEMTQPQALVPMVENLWTQACSETSLREFLI